MKNTKFDFDDILLLPEKLTDIDSRNNVNVFYEDRLFDMKHLPIITAPMSSVVNFNNFNKFNDLNIPVVLPRTEYPWNVEGVLSGCFVLRHEIRYERSLFISLSLGEFEDTYANENFSGELHKYVLIDIANGHMKKILNIIEKMRKIHGNKIKLMIGNIANPETYEYYAKSSLVDYVRVGIGNGNGCLTTQQTGIGYPKASLIHDINQIKKKYDNPPQVIADGGMRDYSDIIKALALGADYVMIGSIFNKAIESCGDNYWGMFKISQKNAEFLHQKGFKVKKEFYGMSTKLAQKKMGVKKLKTSEGVIRYRYVEYTLESWVENFKHYLKSAMSYTNSKQLEDFIGGVDFNLITQSAFKRFNK